MALKPYETPADRQRSLLAKQNIKMASSAHAYVRGNTAQFYQWLGQAEGLNIPHGPAIWICGDCHIGNLGPLADSKGKVAIDIRDLDQTVIGNPAHDLIRLGLSLASAGRGSDLAGVVTANMLEQMIAGYTLAFEANNDKPEAADHPEAVTVALQSALSRKWKHLMKERLGDVKPRIPLGKKFWPLSAAEKKQITALFAEEETRRLVTALRSRDNNAKVRVLDAAYWVKGCSSLGYPRYVVLLSVGDDKERCMIDIKAAVTSVAPRHKESRIPKNNAERVIEGAKHLSPALGRRMLAARVGETAVFLRELLPQDLKLEIEHLTADEAVKVARYLAWVVGNAHARQMTEEMRTEWRNELARHRSKNLDAPSWLWSSVVYLLKKHEEAYLEHCRRYALTLQAK